MADDNMLNTPTPEAAPAPIDITPGAVAVPPAGDPAPAEVPPAGDPVPATDVAKQPADGTILGEDGKEPEAPVPGDWPDDWKEKIAAGDEKLAKLAARYGSPAGVLRALQAAQSKINSTPSLVELPENATEEQVAAYRAAHDVPLKAEDYRLPDAAAFNDVRKTEARAFMEVMHGMNAPRGFVEKALEFHYANVQASEDAQAAEDIAYHQNSDTELRREWGSQYTANKNAIKGMLGVHPPEVVENLLGARLSNGKRLADDPSVLRMLLTQAKELNPAATVIPGGQESLAGLEARKAEIEKRMQVDRTGYFRDEKMQAEYGAILAAEQRMKR